MLKWVVTSQSSSNKNRIRSDVNQNDKEQAHPRIEDLGSAVCSSIEEDDAAVADVTSRARFSTSSSDCSTSTDDSRHNHYSTQRHDHDSGFNDDVTYLITSHSTDQDQQASNVNGFERRKAIYRKKDAAKRHSSRSSQSQVSTSFLIYIFI